MATLLCALAFSTHVLAEDGVDVKWTNEVGSVIKLLNVEASEPISSLRYVTFTYESLKPCRDLQVFGHSYSKDGVQLPLFNLSMASKRDVSLGQKFRDKATVVYEPGHYVVLDKAYCR